eukprot:GEMP01147474.1.p1 GENE.GEMP01147474.1~~GEMP01147474.1.p1  ORF type:complete len:122 (+),score=27.69 GEMP01147474.1:22-366(+)
MPIASKCVELAENNVELRRIPIVPDCANRLSERFVKPAVFRVAKEAAKRVDFLLDFFLGGAMNRFYVYGENTLSAVTLLHRRVQEAVSLRWARMDPKSLRTHCCAPSHTARRGR